MTAFSIVDGNTGEILRIGYCPESAAFLQEIEDHEVVILEESDPLKEYYDPITREKKPRIPFDIRVEVDKFKAVLWNVPAGTKFVVEESGDSGMMEHDGTVRIDFDAPGKYHLRLECRPLYLDEILELEIKA